MSVLVPTVKVAYNLACFVFSVLLETLTSRCLPSERTTGDGAPCAVMARKRPDRGVGGSRWSVAGSGAAWALHRDGFEVHIFEAAATLGGNAKTFLWPDGKRTGLSVQAWPSEYFHNYTALLRWLGVEDEEVNIGFHVRDPKGRDFRHGDANSPLMKAHACSVSRWQRMIRTVRSVNNLFNCFPRRKSLYDLNLLNPLNVVPLRWLSILFGVSRECWDDVIVPVYASTFLSTELDMVPSIILPIVSDIIPLGQPASLRSWKIDSSVVFSKMFPSLSQKSGLQIHLNTSIRCADQESESQLWTVETTSGAKHAEFDRIVFASSAENVRQCTGVLPPRFRRLFSHIRYTQETDLSMHKGVVHSDASIFPQDLVDPKHTDASGYSILQDTANFISVHRRADGSLSYTNTFVLSSWIPSLRKEGFATPRLVTYGLSQSRGSNGTDSNGPEASLTHCIVQNDWNHPVLNPVSLACQYLLRFIQGRRGVYFCGSLATPGNGHDLSLLSGLAVARTMGAEFPFSDSALCCADLEKLQSLMGLVMEEDISAREA